MTEKELVLLNKRFCNDYNVSIQLFQEPYFTDRVKLIGKYSEYLELLRIVKEDFNDNVEEYLSYYNEVKESVIQYIKNSTAFKTLNEDNMSKYVVKSNFPKADIYKEDNIGKKFISIDWKKANFSVLVKYAEITNTEFFNSFDWVDFMKQFTKYEYIVNSKYIRQVVFGNCNPKRQIDLERYYMFKFTESLLYNLKFLKDDMVVSLREDELILDATFMTDEEIGKVKLLCEELESEYLPMSFEVFTLGRLTNTEAYVKCKGTNSDNFEFELKCVNPYEAPFIYRFMRGELLQDTDLYFYNKPYVARFVTYPKDIEIDFGE